MLKNRHDKKVLGATALSMGCLLGATALSSWIRAPKRLESDSAGELARSSLWYGDESAHYEEQVQRLGSYISIQASAAQWQRLRSQMQEQGATEEVARAVLARATSWKNGRQGANRGLDQPLWPLAARAAFVRKQEVWVIYMAYWNPKPVPDCDTEPGPCQMSYTTYVVENKAPYRCFVDPQRFEYSTPQEREGYIVDN